MTNREPMSDAGSEPSQEAVELARLLSTIHVDLVGEPTYAETHGLRKAVDDALEMVDGLRDNAKCACDYDAPGPCETHTRKWQAALRDQERKTLERALRLLDKGHSGYVVAETLRREIASLSLPRTEAPPEPDTSKAIIHHMTLMLDDFGRHEPECVCSGDKTSHAADCADCECGLREAIAFGVEQSYPLEPEPMTPEEQARFHEIGMRVVESVLSKQRGAPKGEEPKR